MVLCYMSVDNFFHLIIQGQLVNNPLKILINQIYQLLHVLLTIS